MRTLIMLLLVVCLGTTSQAQERLAESKVIPIAFPIAQTLDQPVLGFQKSQTAASFFKVKYGRVKRALLFRPKTKRILVA